MPKQATINIKDLEQNTGQLPGLPKNPRFIKDARFVALKQSIQDAPEMLSLRELLVYPLDNGRYVVVGGNMRLRACKDLGYKELPCKVIPKSTPVAKLREYAIKDNVAFGQTDWTSISTEWRMEEVGAWGLETWQAQSPDIEFGGGEEADADWEDNNEAYLKYRRDNQWEERSGSETGDNAAPYGKAGEGEVMYCTILYRPEDAGGLAELLGVAELTEVLNAKDILNVT